MFSSVVGKNGAGKGIVTCLGLDILGAKTVAVISQLVEIKTFHPI